MKGVRAPDAFLVFNLHLKCVCIRYVKMMKRISPIDSLRSFLKKELPEIKQFVRPIDLLAKGTDAGFYRLIPKLVVQVDCEADMIGLMRKCYDLGVAITFKAGGTSLSGQTITDSVLVELGPDFIDHHISADGRLVSFEPGVRGGYANLLLAPYGRKIGPSPASINSAKVGGIVSNNASGSSYGITTNSYHTVESMRIITSDGTVLDTGDHKSREQFRLSHNDMLAELSDIRDEVMGNQDVERRIKHKYLLKNTTGYGMNSFVDFEDPIDIYQHLMVGAEGTLGFISQVTFRTIDDHREKACALVFFEDVREASKAVLPLRRCKVSAAELMDRNALRSVENKPGMPDLVKRLPNGSCALLIESSAPTTTDLLMQIDEIIQAMGDVQTLYPIEFTFDHRQYNQIWKARKGLLTTGAATRPKGTACLIEDIAFSGEVLGDALVALNDLLARRGYGDTVMWGHLLDGNIHFLVTPDFSRHDQMTNYKLFMHELVQLVIDRFDGSLKAEHGTGRNMAPFVEAEWGGEIYSLMKRVKDVCDPRGILNPGVLINNNSEIYALNIKPLPVANPLIDNCIECGFCESGCPSRNFTLTPRQRIVIYREITRLKREKRYSEAAALQRDFDFSGIESCATDGMCAVSCPVEIDTGTLIKELRNQRVSPMVERIGDWIANHFSQSVFMARSTLNAVWYASHLIPQSWMEGLAGLVHRMSGRHIPLWNRHLPKAAPVFHFINDSDEGPNELKVVYFSACINRIFGSSSVDKKEESISEIIVNVLHKAGFSVTYPNSNQKLCCGMAFDSKGFKEQGMMKLKELEHALLLASDNGAIPVVCDMSPCLLRMKTLMDRRLKLYDPVVFTLEHLKDRLTFSKVKECVTVHSTCSNTKMGQEDQLLLLASLCAHQVVVPVLTGCCGWAGDKGFTLPGLNKSALRFLKDEIPANVSHGYSTSRTCEIGLTIHAGITYQSIMYLVDEATTSLLTIDKCD